MRVLWYDIQEPSDPQVNGFGLYRTVVDGTTPLLVARSQIPANPEYSVTFPWEAANATNEQLTLCYAIPGQQSFSVAVQSASDIFEFDAFSRASTVTTSPSWTHTPAGNPGGVIVFVVYASSDGTDEVTTVTYGGITVPRIRRSTKATGETTDVSVYFLGSSVPTGPQTVSVNYTGSPSRNKIGYCITVRADRSVVAQNDIEIINSDSQDVVSASLALSNNVCFVAEGFFSGGFDPSLTSANTGWTARDEVDLGTATSGCYSYNTIAAADVTTGWTQTLDDAVGVAIAVRLTTVVTASTPTSAIPSCMVTQPFELSPFPHLNSENTSGYRATYKWEVSLQSLTQSRMTWAFSSTMADSALGGVVEYDNDPPLGNHLATVYQEHVFLAGDPKNPHYLYFSKRFKPESFPADNFIEIGTPSDPNTAIISIAGLLGVFTRSTKYRVSGNADTGFTSFEALSHRGTRSPKSVVASDKGILFVATDGVYKTNLIAPDEKLSDDIQDIFETDDQKFTDSMIDNPSRINFTYAEKISGAFYKNKYFFAYPSGTSTTPDKLAVYNFDTSYWTIYDYDIASLFVEDDTGYLIGGGIDKGVYILETGTADYAPNGGGFSASAIAAEVLTKSFSGGSYNVRNLFLYFRVDAEVGLGADLTAKFYIDDAVVKTAIVTGSRTNNLISLPENSFGIRWRVGLTVSDNRGGTMIYGVAAVYLPLQAS